MSYTIPAGYANIAVGTTISAHTISGRKLLSWRCPVNMEMEVLSLALLAVIAKRLQVPQHCIHLIWDELYQTTVGVSYTISALDQDGGREWGYGDAHCHCCGDPCADADHSPETNRIQNCFQCEPCFLCPSCRIQLLDGSWRCFDCIEELDGLDIATTTMERLYLVDTARFHELRTKSSVPIQSIGNGFDII